MEKYLQVSSVEELNDTLVDLALEIQYLQDIVHLMHTTTSCFENTIVFTSIDLDATSKKAKLEFQFFEDTPVVELQYSLGNKVYVMNSTMLLLYDTVVTDSTEHILSELLRLHEIAHDKALEDFESGDPVENEDGI